MTELAAAPVPKSASPARWILLGCGLITLLALLGMGGCAGVFYLIYQGTEDTAKIGADYLRAAPQMHQAVGVDGFSVKRSWMGWNVQIVNDGGQAHFAYEILGPKRLPKGTATVHLTRSEGKWSAVSATYRPEAGEPVQIGNPRRELQTPNY